MLAHYHAQVWNGSELARAFRVSHHTVRRYLDALEATFMVRSLKLWSANLGKRQVRSPKVYVRDSGLLHRLLGIDSREQLERHPKVGAYGKASSSRTRSGRSEWRTDSVTSGLPIRVPRST